jgi:hypothetical protein
MPVTKVLCGAREIVISRDRSLVVVTVVVWCPLRILYVLRHAWNRCVSVRQDSGDAGAHQASLILSHCNGLCFGARYESSLWAQRNSHFTWPVTSCGNGHSLMLVANMSYQRASTRYLSWLICNTWSVMGALPVTKCDLRPLPKPVFHVVYGKFFVREHLQRGAWSPHTWVLLPSNANFKCGGGMWASQESSSHTKSYSGLEMMLALASCPVRYVLLLTLNKALPGGCPLFAILCSCLYPFGNAWSCFHSSFIYVCNAMVWVHV